MHRCTFGSNKSPSLRVSHHLPPSRLHHRHLCRSFRHHDFPHHQLRSTAVLQERHLTIPPCIIMTRSPLTQTNEVIVENKKHHSLAWDDTRQRACQQWWKNKRRLSTTAGSIRRRKSKDWKRCIFFYLYKFWSILDQFGLSKHIW